ncbi:MAG: hypothetical protein ACTSUR_08715 [Candidatus Heimdallarchaeaceae archaeon]
MKKKIKFLYLSFLILLIISILYYNFFCYSNSLSTNLNKVQVNKKNIRLASRESFRQISRNTFLSQKNITYNSSKNKNNFDFTITKTSKKYSVFDSIINETWIINTSILVENQIILLNGDLVITKSGNANFTNCQIIFNSSVDASKNNSEPFKIKILGGKLNFSYCTISVLNPFYEDFKNNFPDTNYLSLALNQSSYLIIENSNLPHLGSTKSFPAAILVNDSSIVSISNSNLTGLLGILYSFSNQKISLINSTFTSLLQGGTYAISATFYSMIKIFKGNQVVINKCIFIREKEYTDFSNTFDIMEYDRLVFLNTTNIKITNNYLVSAIKNGYEFNLLKFGIFIENSSNISIENNFAPYSHIITEGVFNLTICCGSIGVVDIRNTVSLEINNNLISLLLLRDVDLVETNYNIFKAVFNTTLFNSIYYYDLTYTNKYFYLKDYSYVIFIGKTIQNTNISFNINGVPIEFSDSRNEIKYISNTHFYKNNQVDSVNLEDKLSSIILRVILTKTSQLKSQKSDISRLIIEQENKELSTFYTYNNHGNFYSYLYQKSALFVDTNNDSIADQPFHIGLSITDSYPLIAPVYILNTIDNNPPTINSERYIFGNEETIYDKVIIDVSEETALATVLLVYSEDIQNSWIIQTMSYNEEYYQFTASILKLEKSFTRKYFFLAYDIFGNVVKSEEFEIHVQKTSTSNTSFQFLMIYFLLILITYYRIRRRKMVK